MAEWQDWAAPAEPAEASSPDGSPESKGLWAAAAGALLSEEELHSLPEPMLSPPDQGERDPEGMEVDWGGAMNRL